MPVVGLVALAGCSSSATAPPNRVVVIGDSAAAVEQPVLASVLKSHYTTRYLIRPYGRIAPVAAATDRHLDDDGAPAAVVVNLGTTEASRGLHTAPNSAPLQPLLDSVSHVPCVVLTTVSLGADRTGRAALALEVNNQIKREAEADPTRFKVVDWENFLATLPPAGRSTYLRADGVHPTVAGAHWLAQSDLAGIQACGTTAQPTVIGAVGH